MGSDTPDALSAHESLFLQPGQLLWLTLEPTPHVATLKYGMLFV